MRRRSWAVVVAGLVLAGCANPPATAPAADELTEWLMTSSTAEAVGDAARDRSWLSEAPGDVADLRAVMAAAEIADVAELDQALRQVRGEMPSLFGALRQRRPGSTRGDLAHWVGVALLTFSAAEPDTALIPASDLWAADYLEDINEVRDIARRGNLERSARPIVVDAEPPPADFAFKPASWHRLVAPLADDPAWPAFAAPASPGIVGLVQLTAGEALESDDYLLAVRRPGQARVRADYIETVAFYKLAEDRQLELDSTGNLALRADQMLTVVADNPERPTFWAWLGDGRLVRVRRECCDAPEGLDMLLWVQLRRGSAKGAWTMVPPSDFRPMSWTEYQEAQIAAGRWAAPSERPTIYPPLGDIAQSRTDRPSIAGSRLMVFRAGLDEGEPLFVVHGSPGLGSRYMREPLIETVGTTQQLFFYDQRGSGYSDGADDPGAFTMRRMVDDLELLRKRAALEQIDLMAHSFGGLVALHYALVYPERVRRLLLIEPEPASRSEWLEYMEVAGGELSMEDRQRFGQYGDEYERANWEATRDLVRNSLGDWDLHERLAEIRVPTLIVAGSAGTLAGAQRLQTSLPASELVVLDGVGHYPFIEAPERFAQAVIDFLRRFGS